MTGGVVLNPLTVAELSGDAGSRELALRCFAPGRSMVTTAVSEADEPDLFAALHDWAIGGGEPVIPPLSREQHLLLWSNGLLVSAAERAAMPADARPVSDPIALAMSFHPALGEFLSRPFAPPPFDPAIREALAATGACELPCIFGADDMEAIMSYYRRLHDENWLKPDHHQTTQKIAKNDPVSRHVQHGITGMMSALFGEAVIPSFSYASEYHSGGDLPRHSDRVQGTYTLSLYIDYAPAQDDAARSPWPLLMHDPEGDRHFHPERGGGILFKGCDIEHSRPPLPEGAHALQVMFCFVQADFAGSLI